MAPTSTMYTLVSSDNKEVQISEKIMSMSAVLTEMFAHCGDVKRIPIPDIDAATLTKVVNFCRKYENEPAYVPPKCADPDNKVPDQNHSDMQDLFMPHDELLKVILAANYLDIPRLIDACCYRMGLMIQGRGVEEIRKIFLIENDFSKAEEEQMQKDHIWYDCPLPTNPKFLQNQ